MHCGFNSHVYKPFNIARLESFKDHGPELSLLGCLEFRYKREKGLLTAAVLVMIM